MIMAPLVGKGYHAIRVLVDEGRLRLKLLMKYGKVELTPPSPRDIPQIRSGVQRLLSGFHTGRWKELSSKEVLVNTLITIEIACWFIVGECVGEQSIIYYKRTLPSKHHPQVNPSQQIITQPESENANPQKPLVAHSGNAWSWLGCSRSEKMLFTPPIELSLLISNSITSFSHAPVQNPIASHSLVSTKTNSIPVPALKTEDSNVSVQIPTSTKTVLSKPDSSFSTTNGIVSKTEITSALSSETEVNEPVVTEPVFTKVIASRPHNESPLVSNAISTVYVPETFVITNSIDLKPEISPENGLHHVVPKQVVLKPNISHSLEISKPVIAMTVEITPIHLSSSSSDTKEHGEYNDIELIPYDDSSNTVHQDGIVQVKTLVDASNISVPFEAKDGIKSLEIVEAAHLPVIDVQLEVTNILVQLESVSMNVDVVNSTCSPTMDYQLDVQQPFISSTPHNASRKRATHVTRPKLTDSNSSNRTTPQRTLLEENKLETTTPLDALNIKSVQSKTEVTVKKLNVNQHHKASQNRTPLKRETRGAREAKSTDASKSNGRPLQQARQLYPDTLRPLDNPKDALQQCFQQLDHTDCRHWEVTIEGLTTLVRLTRHHPTILHGPNLHTAVVAVVKQVRNLRSQIARAACQVSGELFTAFKRALDPDLEEIVSALLHRSADTNKFLRADSNAALDVMLDSCSPAKIVQAIVTKGANHRNATVRTESARLLVSLTTKLGPDRVLVLPQEIRGKILLTGASMLTDSNLETRSYAKVLFRSMSTLPSFYAALYEAVPAQVLKNVQKTILTSK